MLGEKNKNLSYEWYWQGMKYNANRLSPDHLESVTRTLLVTRKIAKNKFPHIWDLESRTQNEKQEACKTFLDHLTFEFSIKCYVKELGHGMNRIYPPRETSAEQLFDRSANGGMLLQPVERCRFSICPEREGSFINMPQIGRRHPQSL